jgi:NAD(P)-dependent dehydrogenase (short-subunit alcohol dehydrogenase family)
LAGQVALVTGAAAGIGRAVALALATEGASLALIDRDEAGLEGTRSAIVEAGRQAAVYPLDLSQSSRIAPLVEAVLRQHGRIDILVNGAGITGPLSPILEADDDAWDVVMTVNLKAPFLFIKHVGRAMVVQGGGRIVNITSSSAHRARNSVPAYGASKAGLMQLTRSAAADLGQYNVNVNAVAPGLTATRIVSDNFTPESLAASLRDGPLANLLQRVSEPEDIAAAILFLCEPGSRQITGQTIHVSGGAIV